MKLRLLFISSFIALNASLASAQIAAPIFTCVRHDTLLWNKPTVSCGAFNSYIIYTSTSRSGPYHALDTITNPNQTFYFNPKTNGNTTYYYLKSDFSCAGQTRLSSDTLSNDPPAITPISTATVLDNQHVDIIWSRNFSPQVAGYIVYKKTTIGLIPLDTVKNRDTTHYTDSKALPAQQSESYEVLALDNCGNASLFDNPHNTILLQTRQSKCGQSITLSWNLYQNWKTPIANQELWVGVHGRNPFLFTTLKATDTAYVYKNTVNKESYHFYLRAVQSGSGGFTSRSNDVIVIADVIQPVTSVILENVNVNASNHIEIIWSWNTDAQIDSFRVLRATNPDSGFVTISQGKPTYPLNDEINFIDTTDARKQPYFYKIQTKDQCGAFFSSNGMSSVFLQATTGGTLKNQLNWTPFTLTGGAILKYQVYRVVKGAVNPVGLPLDTSNLSYIDAVGQDAATACYIIGAKYRYILADGSVQETESRSNQACVQQYARIFTPNAFTPGGHNPEFKPLVDFGQNIGTYSMLIYDRWGAQIFSTTDPSIGWDGKRNGSDQPQGGYLYYIKITQAGQVTENKGVLMLIR